MTHERMGRRRQRVIEKIIQSMSREREKERGEISPTKKSREINHITIILHTDSQTLSLTHTHTHTHTHTLTHSHTHISAYKLRHRLDCLYIVCILYTPVHITL